MVKAVVVGAAGGIGQPLSLLLKSSPLVTELALYDVVGAPGVATDLSHINTPAKVTGYLKSDGGLLKALESADIVVIPAGVPRKPGMTREDLFKINAGIIAEIAEGVASACPKAFILVISNPVNSLVPVFANVLKAKGVFDAKRLFGVTTLDSVRAATFAAEAAGSSNKSVEYRVPVYGGHSGVTIVPIFSQCHPPLPSSVDQSQLEGMIQRVMYGGDEVVKAKDGAGSATLSMAHAGAKFALSLLQAAVENAKGVVLPSYVYLEAASGGKEVQSQLQSDIAVFSVFVELGPNGIESIHGLGSVNSHEQKLLSAALPELQASIETGNNYKPAQ